MPRYRNNKNDREGRGRRGERRRRRKRGKKKKIKKNGTIRAALKRDFWPKRPSHVSTTFHRIPHCLDRSVIHVGINKNSRNDDRLRALMMKTISFRGIGFKPKKKR